MGRKAGSADVKVWKPRGPNLGIGKVVARATLQLNRLAAREGEDQLKLPAAIALLAVESLKPAAVAKYAAELRGKTDSAEDRRLVRQHVETALDTALEALGDASLGADFGGDHE